MRILLPALVVIGTLLAGASSCRRSKVNESPIMMQGFQDPLVETRKLKTSSMQSGPLFKRLSAEESGIDFEHHWVAPEEYPHDLETQMAGGGVAIGDYDGDELPDVYLSRPSGGNRLYRNLGACRFEDVTEATGVSCPTFWGGGASFVDIDDDGDLDLYACGHDCPNRLYINQGNGTFTEKAKLFGLGFRGASVMMSFADYDNDGDLDAYLLTNHLNPPPGFKMGRAAKIDGRWVVPKDAREYRKLLIHPDGSPIPVYAAQFDHLFRNDGPDGHGQIRFTDTSQQAGITGNDHGLSSVWWDYNQDGFPDLYVANDFTDPDRLYKNKGDGTFEEVLADSVPHSPWFSMGADIGDINNDGRMDLIASDMAGTSHYKQKTSMGEMATRFWFLDYPTPRQYMRNAVYLNTGTNRFMEVAFLTGLANTDWTWATRFDDFDNDGRVDLFVTNGMTRDWQNSDLKTAVKKIGGKKSTAGKRFWLKQSAKTEANLAYKNLGDLRFDEVGKVWGLDHVGVSFGAATADLDNDGNLDLVVNNFEEEAAIYRNHSGGNRITLRLNGIRSNRNGIGSTIRLTTEAGTQVRYLTLARGFMSSSQPIVHFGLGERESIKEVTISWPSGCVQSLQNLPANFHYTITEPGDSKSAVVGEPNASPIFRPTNILSGARHSEASFDDFANQPLLPNKLSQNGPGVSCGDIDQDGDEDIFVGGAAGQPGMMMVNLDGRFALSPDSSSSTGVFHKDAAHEDMGSVFLDADADGDLDLYIVSGGVEAPRGSETYRDRLYLNNGRGRFSRAKDAMPGIAESGGVVSAADFDRDGDLDLFVGGRFVPGEYPVTPRSCLFRNDAKEGRVKLIDVTNESAPELRSTGLVTGAVWSDTNNDGWPDLVITHEWGPVKVFRNQDGRLSDESRRLGLLERKGLWNGIAAGDLDNDGDIDFAVSNLGLNTKYHASPEQPLALYYGDFDGSGKRLIEAEYEGKSLLPVRGRSCSTNAIPELAGRFKSYHDFASATLTEIYSQPKLSAAQRLQVTSLESGIFVNAGQKFNFHPLPRIAQASPGFGIAFLHVDNDAFLDLIMVQNFFGPQLETGRMDGGLGMLLRGRGDGTFEAIPPDKSGFVVPGDAKGLSLVQFRSDETPRVIVGINDSPTMAFEPSEDKSTESTMIRLHGMPGNPNGVGSRISVICQNGRKFVSEIYASAGYLSQSSAAAQFRIPSREIHQITVRWPEGLETTHTPNRMKNQNIEHPKRRFLLKPE